MTWLLRAQLCALCDPFWGALARYISNSFFSKTPGTFRQARRTNLAPLTRCAQSNKNAISNKISSKEPYFFNASWSMLEPKLQQIRGVKMAPLKRQ